MMMIYIYIHIDIFWYIFRPGCSMAEIWDIEDEDNRGQTPACTKLKIDPSPYFKKVFENNIYQVLLLT